MAGRGRYPANLHAVGRLLHLLSERICFGPSWGKITGVTRGLAWLLPPIDRDSKGHSKTMSKIMVQAFKEPSHLVRAESMSKTSLARCFLCFCMLGISTYKDENEIYLNSTHKSTMHLTVPGSLIQIWAHVFAYVEFYMLFTWSFSP